jgi:hypothetical protein
LNSFGFRTSLFCKKISSSVAGALSAGERPDSPWSEKRGLSAFDLSSGYAAVPVLNTLRQGAGEKAAFIVSYPEASINIA